MLTKPLGEAMPPAEVTPSLQALWTFAAGCSVLTCRDEPHCVAILFVSGFLTLSPDDSELESFAH